jgi:hypothetical protein
MKKSVKVLAITAALFLTTISVNAQLQLGVKGGLNLSTVSGLKDVRTLSGAAGYSTSFATGFHFGVMLRYDLPVKFFVQPELLFSRQGIREQASGEKAETTCLNFLQLPVYAGYKIGIVPGVGIVLGAGPYLAHRITGINSVVYGKNEDFKRFDAGLSAMCGVRITNLLVTVGYDFGLLDQMDTDALSTTSVIKNVSVKNRNAKASVGFFF